MSFLPGCVLTPPCRVQTLLQKLESAQWGELWRSGILDPRKPRSRRHTASSRTWEIKHSYYEIDSAKFAICGALVKGGTVVKIRQWPWKKMLYKYLQLSKVIWESTVWHFELHWVWLSGDVDWVCYHWDLAEECQLVIRQQTVGFVQEEVAADELLETPVFALSNKKCLISDHVVEKE